jgi:putative DNA primase/helicase
MAKKQRFHMLPYQLTMNATIMALPLALAKSLKAEPVVSGCRFAAPLRAEWPGILRWAIDGCLEWQRIGLAPPEIVRNATSSYLAQEDVIEQWLGERCARDAMYQERSVILFADWKAWAESAGEYVGSQKRFTQALEDRGFTREHNSENQAIFLGLALRWPR